MPLFERIIAVAYSGAETPDSPLKALRVFTATDDSEPLEVSTPNPTRRYWTRREIAHWLIEQLRETPRTLVGIDHPFSFPMRYFEHHRLTPNWTSFLDDFQRHWPTDAAFTYVDFIRDGHCGNGAARAGSIRWRRHTERCLPSARSVFQFDGAGANAKSAHAGIPFLWLIKHECGEDVHFWPFDGWAPPNKKSVVVETFPSLWRSAFPIHARTYHQHAAYAVAAMLQQMNRDETLSPLFSPRLLPGIQPEAQLEGWVLGAMPVNASGHDHPPAGRIH